MSNYKMDIKGNIELQDYSNIHDYIGIVDEDDNFTITIDKCDENNVDIICSMLKDNNFNIIEQGYDNRGVYYINAHK